MTRKADSTRFHNVMTSYGTVTDRVTFHWGSHLNVMRDARKKIVHKLDGICRVFFLHFCYHFKLVSVVFTDTCDA